MAIDGGAGCERFNMVFTFMLDRLKGFLAVLTKVLFSIYIDRHNTQCGKSQTIS